ncbi:hypothetical protein J1782_00105, partial [Rahnella sp. BCC 1045]|uniref:hypothetical protein n=1 Tax=Rahnella sp. BCC 1045 TaxID=2816251 RepID=UPI001C267DB1
AVIAGSDHVSEPAVAVVFTVGVAFAWIGTGLFAWWRRPVNRVGALMTWTGFAFLLNAFVAANSSALFTLAAATSNVYLAAFVHLLLADPEGTLRRSLHRRLVAATYGLALLGPLPLLLSARDASCGECPDSFVQVTEGTTLGTSGDALTSLAAVV